METMIQPKVTGYRQLTEAEVALMNEGKALADGAAPTLQAAQALPGRRPATTTGAPEPGPALDQHRRHGPATRLHGRDPAALRSPTFWGCR